MNHLAGLDVPNPGVKDGEEAALAAFKKEHNAHKDADSSATPTWAIEPDALPESGWRSLDDYTLLRFLRADERGGKFDGVASRERLTRALAWRKEMRLDATLATPPPRHDEYLELRVRRWVGLDHKARPVQFELLGAFLASGNVRAFAGGEWLAHYARDVEQTFERMREASEKSGTAVCGYLFIADLEGFGLGSVGQLRAVVPLLKLLTKEVESHFPEIVDAIVLFNAPRVFATAFPLVKAFMDPITAAKIEVHAGVPSARLLELMPSATLPANYGGTASALPRTKLWSAQPQGATDGSIVNN